MEAIKFTTNIKCTGCLAKLTPFLNETAGEDNWEVDLQDPKKTLTVVGSVSENEILATVKEAGFVAQKL